MVIPIGTHVSSKWWLNSGNPHKKNRTVKSLANRSKFLVNSLFYRFRGFRQSSASRRPAACAEASGAAPRGQVWIGFPSGQSRESGQPADAQSSGVTPGNYGVNITSWKHAPIFLKGLLVTLKIPKHHENSIVMTCIYNNTHIYTYTLLPLVFELLLSNRADYSN